ncbi:MAG: hypothetical protein IPL48_15750 [Bacteroidetes bacterium]|nr:hypothetical protein [Bacteroidota bacterium]
MVLLQCNKEVVETSFNGMKFLQELGPVIISALALFLSYFLTKKTLNVQKEQTQRTLDAQKDVEARLLIRKKLDEFYGPLLQLRKKSNLLYKKFIDRHRVENENFSTLTYLLKGGVFLGNDKILLEEIISLGEESEKLIHSKAGLIDDTYLRQTLIPRATTHYLLLRLAYKGALTGDAEQFKDLSFPKELDDKLETRKKQLEIELENLNKKAS